jgi:pimeloyl-ACP methyl ester carboxylesterase
MLENDKQGYFKTTGSNVYYETKGTGPCLLFLHAGIADCRMWEREFHAMAEHFQVIRFDLPGFGLSEFTGGSFSYTGIISGLLDHLNVDKVHVLAASYGGKIAIDFVLTNQQRCFSLALLSPAISGWEDSQYLQEEGRLLEAGEFAEVAELNYYTWILRGRHPELVASSIKELVVDMQLKALTKQEPDEPCEEIAEEDSIERIGVIKIPVLIMIGDQDVQDFQGIANLICHKVSTSSKVVIPNAAHLANLEAPVLFEQTILDFFLHSVASAK